MSEQQIEQNEAEQEQQQPDPVEEQAKAIGWRPPEEMETDPDKPAPLTAQEFIDRNERLKKRGDDILKAENSKLSRRLGEMQSTLDSLVAFTKKADSRAYKKALADIRSEQRAAVEEGDVQRFDAASAAADELAKEMETETREPGKKPEASGDSPVFQAWHADNAWYGPGGNARATLTANQAAEKLAGMGYTEEQLYAAVTDIVKEEHPELFKSSENTNRKRPAAVEGAQNSGGGNNQSTGLWNKVPKDDQQTFKAFVEQGLFKDTKEDREAYAATYFENDQ